MAKRAGFGAARVRRPPVAGDVERAGPTATPKRPYRRAAQASRGHESRLQQTRAMQELHPESEKGSWSPGVSLEAPPSRPGYRQKWVRVAVYGRDDVQNVARKFREGWLPRQAETSPKSFSVPTISSGRFAGAIGVEGMILCEMPEKQAAKRNAFWHRKAEMMAQDIEKNIASANQRIPHHAGFGRITKTAMSKVVRPAPVDTEEELEA